MADHRRARGRAAAPLPPDGPAVEPPDEAASDAAFLEGWRAELVARAWDALAAVEAASGQPLYTVLRLRADHPNLSAAELAAWVSATLGRAVDAGWVRKRLHFARARYAALLVDEVRETLDRPSVELDDELIALGLFEYCRQADGGRGIPSG